MNTVTTLSPTAVEAKRQTAIKKEATRKSLSLGQIELVDDTKVKVDGHLIAMQPGAINQLVKVMGLPVSFTQELGRMFNQKSKVQFINTLSRAMSQLNSLKVTAIVNPNKRLIVGFTSHSGIITNENFFHLADEIVKGQGFGINQLWTDEHTGAVSMGLTLEKPVDIQGMTNEAFTAGLNITNNPITGIQVSPYMNRLWCANGCSTAMAQSSYMLNDLSNDSTAKFFEHINHLRKTGFVPNGLGDTIRNAANTPASMAELRRAHNSIKDFVGNRAESIIPLERNVNAYSQMGVDLDKVNTHTAESNQSIWSLVNAQTWVASNSDKMFENNIQESDKMNLQVKAGNMLDGNWHLQQRVKSPFNGLNKDEQIGIHLN